MHPRSNGNRKILSETCKSLDPTANQWSKSYDAPYLR